MKLRMTRTSRALFVVALIAVAGCGTKPQAGSSASSGLGHSESYPPTSNGVVPPLATAEPDAPSSNTTGATAPDAVPTARSRLAAILPSYALDYSDADLRLLSSAADQILHECDPSGSFTALADLPTRAARDARFAYRLFLDDLPTIRVAGYEAWKVFPDPEPLAAPPDGGSGDPLCWDKVYAAFSSAGAGYLRNDGADILGGSADPLVGLHSVAELEDVRQAWSACMADAGFAGQSLGSKLEAEILIDVGRATADAECRTRSGYREASLEYLAIQLSEFLSLHSDEVARLRQAQIAELEIARAILNG